MRCGRFAEAVRCYEELLPRNPAAFGPLPLAEIGKKSADFRLKSDRSKRFLRSTLRTRAPVPAGEHYWGLFRFDRAAGYFERFWTTFPIRSMRSSVWATAGPRWSRSRRLWGFSAARLSFPRTTRTCAARSRSSATAAATRRADRGPRAPSFPHAAGRGYVPAAGGSLFPRRNATRRPSRGPNNRGPFRGDAPAARRLGRDPRRLERRRPASGRAFRSCSGPLRAAAQKGRSAGPGRPLEEALACFDRLGAAVPGDVASIFSAAELCQDNGRSDLAAAWFARAEEAGIRNVDLFRATPSFWARPATRPVRRGFWRGAMELTPDWPNGGRNWPVPSASGQPREEMDCWKRLIVLCPRTSDARA